MYRAGVSLALVSALELPLVPALPDPFLGLNGQRASSRAQWPARRAELAELVQRYAYGPYPPEAHVRGTLTSDRTRLVVTVRADARQISFEAPLSLPAGKGPFPAFVLIQSSALAAERLRALGIACIVLDAKAIAVDRKLELPGAAPRALRRGLLYDLYGSDVGTGALMAWAWAVHRIVDALRDIPALDATRVAVNGFSRFGKAAALAGAFDERIALTVPSSSGQAGAGNFRSTRGVPGVQTIEQIAEEAPHWFGDAFPDEFGRATHEPAQRIPFDAHSVLALIAPRALLVTEGGADSWNYPPGPALTLQATREVYTHLGAVDRLGFRHVPATGHRIDDEQQSAIEGFAQRFLIAGPATRAVFDEPFGPPPAALLPWRAPT